MSHPLKNKTKTTEAIYELTMAKYLRMGFHLYIVLGDEAVFSAQLCLVPVLITLFI